MSSVQNSDADREDYVVSVVEFAGDPGAATAALQRVFGLDSDAARAILREVPIAVRRGVNRIRAEYFRRALELSGARVEVRDGEGAVVSAPNPAQPSVPTSRGSLPQPATAQPAAAVSNPAIAAASSPAAPRGWGDLQPFKAAAPPAKARVEAPQALVAPAPAPAPEEEWALKLDAEEGPLDSPFAASGGEDSVELASLPASPAGAARRSADDPRTLDFDTDGAAPAVALELDFERGRKSDRASPRYEAIPAGEQWRAPGARTLATAQRKQAVQSLESGLGEVRPTSDPSALAASSHPPHGAAGRAPARAPSGDLRAAHGRAPSTDLKASPARAPSGDLRAVQARAPSGDLRGSAPGERARVPARPASGDLRPSGTTAAQPVRQRHSRDTVVYSLGDAARIAVSGTATAWLGVITLGSVLLGGAAALSVRLPLLGIPVLLTVFVAVLAQCGEYQRHAFWAAATREPKLSQKPSLQVAPMIRSGVHFAALALVMQALLWVWLGGEFRAGHGPLVIAGSPALWVLGLGPGLYWPIALACAAARNRAAGVWDFVLGVRALMRGPGVLLAASLSTSVVSATALLAGATLLAPIPLDAALAFGVACGPAVALAHGLGGAFMGRALHAKPNLFK